MSGDKELDEALEMLGKGYDHTAPPREIISRVSGYTIAPDILSQEYGYVTSLVWGRIWRFCQMSDGVCRAGLEKIAKSLGMSERTIMRHLDLLVSGEYLKDMTPNLKNKPHIYADTGKIRIAFSSEAIVSTMTESQRAMTESQRRGDRESVEDSIKRESKIKPWDEKFSNMPLDWLIASGMEIPQELLDSLKAKKLATDTFEKAFGFGTLPWASNTTWEKFYKWVVKIHAEYPTLFQEYADWREDAGKYKAMSNKQIRMNPLTFIDTGYPEFKASKMYVKPKSAAENTPREEIPAGWQRIYDNA